MNRSISADPCLRGKPQRNGVRHLGQRVVLPSVTPAMPACPHELHANIVGTTDGAFFTAPPPLRNAASAASASLLRSARLTGARPGWKLRRCFTFLA
jgi:hypothetical protein